MDETHLREADEVVFSFSKAGAFILFGYFMLKLIDMLVQANLPYLCTGYGLWWLVEMLFFVLTPALLYAKGSRDRNIKLCRFASANAVLGIVLNRFNVSMIAFNYALPADERLLPQHLGSVHLHLRGDPDRDRVPLHRLSHAGAVRTPRLQGRPLGQEENHGIPYLYDYFLYTKNWAYVMMFVTLPVYVLYWNTVLFPKKGPWLFGDDDEH